MNRRSRFSQFRTIMGIMHGNRTFGGPFQARLSLTNRCNIKCIHCYFFSPYLEGPTAISKVRTRQLTRESDSEHSSSRRLGTAGLASEYGMTPPYDKKPRSLLRGPSIHDGQSSSFPVFDADTGVMKSLIGEMLDMGTAQILFSGRGEPFIHKDAIELMGYAKRGGAACLVNTNGTLLDRAAIDELVKMGFDELRITVMGGSSEVYTRTHPGVAPGTFDSLKENLLYLAEQKSTRSRKKPRVTLVSIVVAQNHDRLSEFAEFAAGVYADRVLYRPVDDVEDPGLSKLVLNREQALHAREQVNWAAAYLEGKGISHNIKDFLRVFNRQLDTSAFYRIYPCYYVWLSSMVEVDGTVYPCCRCFEPLGNAFEKGFAEIWNGEIYRLLRKEALKINRLKKLLKGCRCHSCVNHEANAKVYRMLHPIKGRTAALRMRRNHESKE